ncbi:unnamed protein product [Rotaria sp. Silwood2]|nr:unnamed protein product [Rotaria sp. Silwood2]
MLISFRKRWYENTQDKICNSSLDLFKSTRLTLRYADSDDIEELMTVATRGVLTVAQVYDLEIPEEKIFIGAFIKILNLLPELKTLKMHSLSYYEPRILYSEELFISSSTEDTSKITNVCLEKMNEILRIFFSVGIMSLYGMSQKDCNDRLCLLCFRIPTVDDEMIRKLKRMINFEKLLFNYTIKRVADFIYIEWEEF